MKTHFAFAALTLASFACYVGCGGSEQSALIAPVDGGTDGTTTTPDGGAVDDATSDSSPATDGAVARDGAGGSFTDGPPTAIADGGGSNDSGPGGDTSSIACGSTSCSLASSFCCVYTNNNPPPEFVFGCATGTGCPARAGAQDPAALACSSAANCPANTVCCLKDTQGKTSSECVTTCASSNNVKAAQLCDRTAPQTGCPASAPCSANNINDWKLPNGFATCGGKSN